MRTVLANLSILSSVFLLASASAQQVCPAGYSDQNSALAYWDYISVGFQGNTYNCERENGTVKWRAKCGSRVRVGDNKFNEVHIMSQEGVEYKFSGNNDASHKVTKDCSAGSSCLVRTEYTNNAKNEYVNFSVPITTVTIVKRGCDRLSF